MFPDLFFNPEEKDPNREEKVKHLKQQRQDLEIRKHQGRITKEAYQVQLKQLEAKEEELRQCWGFECRGLLLLHFVWLGL